MQLFHHGGHEGVTGSCHQLKLANGKSILVDCGIFQGEDARRHPNLLDFVRGMQTPPGEVVIVHGESDAKRALRKALADDGINVRT